MPSEPTSPTDPSPGAPSDRAGRYRLRGACVGAACAGALLAAAMLSPDPSGRGTHRQWGVPACAFEMNHGLPCPSCGMTTAMAATLRGRLGLAFRAQPFGPVLVVAILALGVAGLVELVLGRDVLRRLRLGWWWLAAGLGGMAAGWVIVLAIRGAIP